MPYPDSDYERSWKMQTKGVMLYPATMQGLIEAAPELLALLRECSTALADLLADADPSGLECQEQWACVAECKQAIAKAEGWGE